MESRKAEGLVSRWETTDISIAPQLYPTQSQAVLQCRGCRFFTPIGRRGGECARFVAPVAGTWPACALAESVFALDVSAVTNPPWALSPELGQGEAPDGAAVKAMERSRVD